MADVAVEARLHRQQVEGRTDSNGAFSLSLPADRLRGATLVARSQDESLLGYKQLPWDTQGAPAEPVQLQLAPSKLVKIHVIDGAGQPVDGAHSGVIGGSLRWTRKMTDENGQATIAVPQDLTLRSVYAWKPAAGIDYRNLLDLDKLRQGQPQDELDLSQPFELVLEDPITVNVRIVEAQNNAPLPNIRVYPWLIQKPGESDELNLSFLTDEISAMTDAEGVARFDWLPAWNERQSITFWPNSDEHVRARGNYEPANASGELTIALDKFVAVSGQVRLPDGSPAAGINVQVRGEGYQFDGFRSTATTNEEGRYELGVAPNMVYLLVVDDEKWAAAPQTGFAILPGQPRDGLDFDLRPATRIFGRVTIGEDKRPVEGQRIYSYQRGADLHNLEGVTLPNPEGSRKWVQPNFVRSTMTDKQGHYELFVGPGDYDLRGPQQVSIEKFTITDESEKEFNFHSPREEKGRLAGRVIDKQTGKPVPQAEVTGIYRHPLGGSDLSITTDARGEFDVERELHRTVMYARTPDGQLAGLVESGPDEKNVTIPIQPTAAITAILIDQQSGEPMPDREIRYGRKVPMGDDDAPWRTSFGGTVQTGPDGSFRLDDLVVGEEYDISVTMIERRGWRTLTKYTPESSGEEDLGRLELAPPRAPYKPPTLQERIAGAFQSKETAAERLDKARRDARLGHIPVLLVLADPESEATEAFFKLRYEDRDVRTALFDYRVIALPITGERASEALELATKLGEAFSVDVASPRLVVVSAEGDVVTNVTTADLEKDGALDPQELIAFLEHYRLPHLDGQQLFEDALARAAKENKRVIVQETATWCGPCWSLSRFLDDHRETFEKDYIHVKMDHRWDHWEEVMDGIESEHRGGVPWFAILDADGNVLADSNGPDGNIGYPAGGEPEGIAHFLGMLRASAIRLSDEDLARLEADLQQR